MNQRFYFNYETLTNVHLTIEVIAKIMIRRNLEKAMKQSSVTTTFFHSFVNVLVKFYFNYFKLFLLKFHFNYFQLFLLNFYILFKLFYIKI